MSTVLSNYNDSGYSFTTNSTGMMLVSKIATSTSKTALKSSTSGLTGCNDSYPQGVSGNPTSLVVNSIISGDPIDIYYRQPIGVYIINGTVSYPVFTSNAYVPNIGIPNNVDNAILVYPGWGFRLFSGPSGPTNTFYQYPPVAWEGETYTYFNDTTEIALFTAATGINSNQKYYAPSGSDTTGYIVLAVNAITIPIMYQYSTNSSYVNRSFPDDACDGIKIFFRSNDWYNIPGLPS